MITERIKEQIEAIEESGVCNMLDYKHVQYEANTLRFFDLVIFIEEDKRAYQRYIMHGDKQ